MNVRYPVDTIICERGHEWLLRVDLTHPRNARRLSDIRQLPQPAATRREPRPKTRGRLAGAERKNPAGHAAKRGVVVVNFGIVSGASTLQTRRSGG